MPEHIGAYRLESPLGRGGMGEVFLAWDERLERPVAVKRIRHDAFAGGPQRERFRREARMAARLSHPGIVQVHDLVIEESGDAIVMEYVEGPTLAERLARGPLAIAEAIQLAREIAEGLAAAHEAGLIHRDLKAENVVITSSGHPKILDFGLARPISWDGEALTQHGALVGTCYAMSPEQASGGELDERSDLFSFGALLYEMLAGCSPFRAKDPQATLRRVLCENPPPLQEVRPDLPPALGNLVDRLLAKDRDQRPRNALHVAHKLERIERELPPEEWPERNDDSMSEMPTQAFPALPLPHPASAAHPSSPAVRGALLRSRSWIFFLAGALVALVGAVSLSYLLDRGPTEPRPQTVEPRPRPDAPNPEAAQEVQEADRAAFLEIRKRIDQGQGSPEDLASLEKIIRTSPRYPDAQILASELYRSRFQSGKDPADRARARELAQQAQDLAPSNPGTWIASFRIALEENDFEEAEEALKHVGELMRGDPQVFVCKAELAKRQGRTEDALRHLRNAARIDPSWRNLYALADLAARSGYVAEARRHLKELLNRSPDNRWGLALRAEIELVYGDIKKAEEHYGELAAIHPMRSFFTNLGLARFLLGDHQRAIDAYQKALEIEPGHAAVMLNLAEAELALGNRAEADRLLRKTLLAEESRTAGGFAEDGLIQAQCLARLDQPDKAVRIALQSLKKGSDDPQVLYMGALVLALAGDKTSALIHARDALKKEMAPEWFLIPAFDSLREDPELRDLLDQAVRLRSS